MARGFQYSIRLMLGLMTAACVAAAIFNVFAESAGKSSVPGGLVLALLAITAPSIIAVSAANVSGYGRSCLVGALIPAVAAAVFFVLALHGSYSGQIVRDFETFKPVIARMIYYRHALLLIWATVPIGGLVGLSLHWFSGPHGRARE